MIESIEQVFRLAAQYAALAIEAIAIVTVAVGATEATISSLKRTLRDVPTGLALRAIWLRFAAWILLALEFALGADVIRTAVAPSWSEIGKLGAIAVIRTGLSFFLARDLNEVKDLEPAA